MRAQVDGAALPLRSRGPRSFRKVLLLCRRRQVSITCTTKMLIKNMDEKDTTMDPENLNIIRRIIDDFENTQQPRNLKKKSQCRKISRSDSIINRNRISPKNNTITSRRVLHHHRSYDGRFFHAVSLQDVVKSEDSLYLNIYETNTSVENTDANSPKNFNASRRQTKAFIGNNVVSKVLDEAAAAAAEKRHQEMVMKGVQEVRGLLRLVNERKKNIYINIGFVMMMVTYNTCF